MRYTQNIIATFCPRLKFIRVDSAADGGYSSEGDYGHGNLPPLPSFIPVFDEGFTTMCQRPYPIPPSDLLFVS